MRSPLSFSEKEKQMKSGRREAQNRIMRNSGRNNSLYVFAGN